MLDGVRILGLPGKIDEASIKFEIVSPGEARLATHAVPASKVRISCCVIPMPLHTVSEAYRYLHR